MESVEIVDVGVARISDESTVEQYRHFFNMAMDPEYRNSR